VTVHLRSANRVQSCGADVSTLTADIPWSLCDRQSGLIAGGLADGTVGVWSADKILDADEDAEDVPEALLTTLSGHTGPVSLHRCAAARLFCLSA
jgi:hypothetical protein